MNNNLITIADKEIELKEYNGERVVTAWDIEKLHEKDVREINQQFKRNIKNLIENEDYFVVDRSYISESQSVRQTAQPVIQNFIPNNVKEIILFTESGYLLLTKTFTDERSWNIQRQLVKSYFKLKELKEKVEAGEIEIKKKINNERKDVPVTERERIENHKLDNMVKLIEMFRNSESKPEKLMIIEALSEATGNKNKFGYGMADGATTELRKDSVTATEIADMMCKRYGLDPEKFTALSIGSYASSQKLKQSPYSYLYYDENTMTNNYRYFPQFVIPRLLEVIMDTKKKRYKNYGLSEPYQFMIDDEEF